MGSKLLRLAPRVACTRESKRRGAEMKRGRGAVDGKLPRLPHASGEELLLGRLLRGLQHVTDAEVELRRRKKRLEGEVFEVEYVDAQLQLCARLPPACWVESQPMLRVLSRHDEQLLFLCRQLRAVGPVSHEGGTCAGRVNAEKQSRHIRMPRSRE